MTPNLPIKTDFNTAIAHGINDLDYLSEKLKKEIGEGNNRKAVKTSNKLLITLMDIKMICIHQREDEDN